LDLIRSFAADNGSAVVLSGDCSSSKGPQGGLRLEAKFGHDVPDNPQEWGLGHRLINLNQTRVAASLMSAK